MRWFSCILLSILLFLYIPPVYGEAENCSLGNGVSIAGSGAIMGDLNGDGNLNIFDLLEILKVLVTPVTYSTMADLDNNGSVETFDLVLLLTYLKEPPIVRENIIVSRPISFPVELDHDQNFFKLIVQSASSDTLIISLPTARNQYGRLRFYTDDLEELCLILNVSAYNAYRAEKREWDPVGFTPIEKSNYFQKANQLIILPDSGLSVILEPAYGKEEILEKLGFPEGNRKGRPTALQPDKFFYWNGIIDSLASSPVEPAPALVHIKVRRPETELSINLNTSRKTTASASPRLAIPPSEYPYLSNIHRVDPWEIKYYPDHILMDTTISDAGTFYLENTVAVKSGASIVIFTDILEFHNYTAFTKNMGMSDVFYLEPNRCYDPEILHLDQMFAISAHIEIVSDTTHYVVWDSLGVAEYYFLEEIVDDSLQTAQQIQSPWWRVSNLNAEKIIYNISAKVFYYKFQRSLTYSFIYRPLRGTFEEVK